MPTNFKVRALQKYLNQINGPAFISAALILVFTITLFTAYSFPIYSDEIQVRFWLSRLPYDFPEKISGTPPCSSTFFQSIPWSMYAPGVIDWVIHGRLESLPALRQVGITIAFLWVAGLAFYLNTRFQNAPAPGNQLSRSQLGLYITGFIIAIFSTGVFPIFLIINRGEQLILPSIILLVAIFLVSKHLDTKGNLWQKTGLIVLYFICISMVLYSHAKGLFFTPFFIVVGWQLFSHFKSHLPLALAMALLTLHAALAYISFKYAFQCHELPQFENELKSYSFDPLSLFYEPINFLNQAYHSLTKFPKYLSQLGFQEQADANYLPSLPLSVSAMLANIFIKLNIVIAFFTLLIALPFQYFRKDVTEGRLGTINFALLVLFICALISAIFNIPKNWYDAGYLYALLLIILIFFLGENYSGLLQKPAARKIFIYLGITALLSQAVFIQRNLPPFLNGYTGPGVSIATYDAIKTRDDLDTASKACNIDPVHSKKVVVDDYTYLYFQKSKWPMAISYIWFLPDDKSIQQFFAKTDSDGLIVNCSGVLAPYMPFVKRVGNVCCIPKEDLKSLSSLPVQKMLKHALALHKPIYKVGFPINFSINGNGEPYLNSGWGVPQNGFTWTVGKSSNMTLPVSTTESLMLEATLSPFVVKGKLDRQHINVYANGEKVAQWIAESNGLYKAVIPAHLTSDGLLELRFDLPDATSQTLLGLNSDAAVLGMQMQKLTLNNLAYQLGSQIQFGDAGNSTAYLNAGWGAPQKGFTWTVGKSSNMVLPVSMTESLMLEATLSPFVVKGKLDRQHINVFANGKKVTQWIAESNGLYKAAIPARLISSGLLELRFDFPDATSQALLGLNSDAAILGMQMQTMTLHKVESQLPRKRSE